jgi:hypothetical protein
MAAEDPFWTRLPKLGTGALRGAVEFGTDPSTLVARNFCFQVLKSAPVAGIAFTLPWCSVDPEMFADIRTAILRGAISTRIMGPGDPDAEHGQAVFIPEDDVMKIADGDWLKRHRFVTAVVHESVHAHHDMSGRADLRVVDTETAAYVAECVYTRRWEKYAKATHRPSFLCDRDNAEFNAIFAPAWALALRIVDDGHESIAKADADLVSLVDAIKACSVYSHNWDTKIVADGLRW